MGSFKLWLEIILKFLDINEDKYSDFLDYENTYEAYGDYNSDGNSIVKVLLYNSVTDYTQIYRACNYGFLFILMSLVIVYIFEIVSKKCSLCAIYSSRVLTSYVLSIIVIIIWAFRFWDGIFGSFISNSNTKFIVCCKYDR